MRKLLIAIATSTLFGAQAMAAGPTAIVEDVNARAAGVDFMEYVDQGRTIKLGAKGTLVLGYLGSCLREIITGGTVTVGKDKSRVKGGKVTRERVECDGGKLQLTDEQAGKSAVVVFRKAPTRSTNTAAFRIYGTSPVIRPRARVAEIVIERLDRPTAPMRFKLKRGYVDLASGGQALKPRGLYRVRAGSTQVVFRVDAYARPGAGPIVGRLVSF